MLTELSKVEQRFLAARSTRSGRDDRPGRRCLRCQSTELHRLLTDCRNGELEALAKSSSRPDTSPTRMDPRIETRLVMMRR